MASAEDVSLFIGIAKSAKIGWDKKLQIVQLAKVATI
jgi:hypothetical protein